MIVKHIIFQNGMLCIMDTGQGIQQNQIIGDAMIGSTVELVNGKYTVVGSASSECEV